MYISLNRTFSFLLCFVFVFFGFLNTAAFAHEADTGSPGDLSQYVTFNESVSTWDSAATGAGTMPSQDSQDYPYPVYDSQTAEQKAKEAGVTDLFLQENGNQADENTFVIKDRDEFLAFAASCSDRMWSVGKTVSLEADIDLENVPFTPISSFSGRFYGNKHTISGLLITGNYIRSGLFAILTDSAYVSEVRVIGNINVRGSGTENSEKTSGTAVVGGIAGENSGTIQNVIFQGDISSDYAAGGIAGLNLSGAYITDSKTSGTVSAPACSGGICADNKGSLISCINFSLTSSKQNSPRLISRKISKIAGTSSGVMQNCSDNSKTQGLQINGGLMLLVIFVILGLQFLSGAVVLFMTIIKKQ